MNIAKFGNTLKNIRNWIYIPLISSDEKAKQLAVTSNYKRCTILDGILVAIHMKKTKLTLINLYIMVCVFLTLVKLYLFIYYTIYIAHKSHHKQRIGDACRENKVRQRLTKIKCF